MGLFRRRLNVQPLLDYFEMLYRYKTSGLLEVYPEKHEAYVTQPALHAVTPGDDPREQIPRALQRTVMNIRAYAAWLSQHGGDYVSHPFAMHVVKEDERHDLLYTLYVSRHRVWWKLWLGKSDHIEVIGY